LHQLPKRGALDSKEEISVFGHMVQDGQPSLTYYVDLRKIGGNKKYTKRRKAVTREGGGGGRQCTPGKAQTQTLDSRPAEAPCKNEDGGGAGEYRECT